MKSLLPAFILSLISSIAIAQSPVQQQNQAPVKTQSQSAAPAKAVSLTGALAGGGGGAAAAAYAATGRMLIKDNPADSNKTTERRRVEVLKSNKTGDPKAIAVNPLYTPSGNSAGNPLYNPASRSINESGVSVKSNIKPKPKQ